MDLLTATRPAPIETATTRPTPASSGALSSDFETFLKMLTTQMRNQDPLNPADPADFAVQLATFSSVEQQVQTNDLLRDLSGQIATLGMGQLAGWIGLDAEVAAPVKFQGDPVTLTATVAQGADAAELVVTDAQGIIVQRVAIGPQSGPVTWNGRDPLGRPLPDGTYEITAQSFVQGEPIARENVHLRSRIEEARLEGGEVRLILETGQSVSTTEVLGLRPRSPSSQ